MKRAFCFFLFLLLIAVGCRSVAEEIEHPTAVILPAEEPTATLAPVPTNLPDPTPTPFPTGTPEEFIPSPTPIQVGPPMDTLLLVAIDPSAEDGVKVRTGPGYECEEDPDCNWAASVFPEPDEEGYSIFFLLEVDHTDPTQAWCQYVSNFSEGTYWSACEFLAPATEEDCIIAEKLNLYDMLAPCLQ